MKRIPRPSPALFVACLALLVALGGTSIAAVKVLAPRNSVGTLQVINKSLLPIDFKTPPKGSQGPGRRARPGRAGRAAPGPAGTAAAKGDKAQGQPRYSTALWAQIDSAGSVHPSKGVASAQKLATGDYLVTFNQDVTACTYQATLGGPTTGLTTGEVSAAPRRSPPESVSSPCPAPELNTDKAFTWRSSADRQIGARRRRAPITPRPAP